MKTLLWTGLFATALWGQGHPRPPQFQFPQHSTGWPSPIPLPNNHITNLSGSINGRPQLAHPGARPIYPMPVFIGGSGWFNPPAPQVVTPVVVVTQPAPQPPPQPPVLVVNPDYKPEVARPVMREYSAESKPYENFQPATTKIFLLALKDGTLRQAVAFWRENDLLHFVQPDHKQNRLKLAEMDLPSTRRFNKERGIEIQLPE